jgi:predicted N-acyltransferase
VRSFEEYLATFSRNQRRNIRRERSVAARENLRISTLTGPDIRQTDLRFLYGFYERTNAQFGPWAAKYLNEAFFVGLAGDFRERVLLFRADREGAETPLAMSLLLTKGSQLWGRYWGSEERVDGLHFELCYYRPIEWAIAHGIQQFDPGIGGEHKVRRGFRAVPNHSLHRFSDRRLQALMAAHIHRINAHEQERIDQLNRALPLVSPEALGNHP